MVAELIFGRQFLVVGENLDTVGRKVAGDELGAHKFAGREKQIDAALIGFEPPVEVGFGGEDDGTGARTRVTALGDDAVKSAVAAGFADFALGHEVIGGAEHFEIVEVINNGDAAALEFPEDGGREVMIDTADVGEVGGEIGDAIAHGAARGAGINRVGGHSDFAREAGAGILEIDVRDAIAASGECVRRAVLHAE